MGIIQAVKLMTINLKRWITVVGVVLLCGGWLRAGDLKVTFVNVGQGDCIHVQTPAGMNYLIDGGDTSDPNNPPALDDSTQDFCPVVRYLLDNDIRTIDLILKSHDDSDHYRGLQAVFGTKTTSGGANAFTVRAILYSSNTSILSNLSVHPETKSVPVTLGMHLESNVDLAGIWDPGLTAIVLNPQSFSSDPGNNDNSIVLKLKYGEVGFLLTGDSEVASENLMLSSVYRPEMPSAILKVSHHGSRSASSSAFLDVVKPQIAVVGAAPQAFGLPDAEVIQRLQDKGAAVYRTDRNGHVTVRTNGVTTSLTTSLISAQTGAVSEEPVVHAYPNPAPGLTNPAKTTFVYELKGLTDNVRVAVYGLAGELVREWSEESKSVGRNYLDWDLRNQDGEEVANGLYFVQVEASAGGGSQIGRAKFAVLRK